MNYDNLILERMVKQKPFNLVRLSRQLETRDDSLKFLQDHGVLKKSRECPHCGDLISHISQYHYLTNDLASNEDTLLLLY